MNYNNNPIFTDSTNDLYKVYITVSPNEISARCRELQIEVDEDEVIHLMDLIRKEVRDNGGIDWDLVNRVIAEFHQTRVV